MHKHITSVKHFIIKDTRYIPMREASVFVKIRSLSNCGSNMAENPNTCPMLRLDRKHTRATMY